MVANLLFSHIQCFITPLVHGTVPPVLMYDDSIVNNHCQDYLAWIGLEEEFGNFGPEGEGGLWFERGHENKQFYIDQTDPDNVKKYEQYNKYENKLFGRYLWTWSPHCNP